MFVGGATVSLAAVFADADITGIVGDILAGSVAATGPGYLFERNLSAGQTGHQVLDLVCLAQARWLHVPWVSRNPYRYALAAPSNALIKMAQKTRRTVDRLGVLHKQVTATQSTALCAYSLSR